MVDTPFIPDLRLDAHRDHEAFARGLAEQRKVMISFLSKGGRDHELRLVAPVDFGPLWHGRDRANRYHMFDYTGEPPHPMALRPDQIFRMRLTREPFDPGEFLASYPRPPRWWTPRHWVGGWEF